MDGFLFGFYGLKFALHYQHFIQLKGTVGIAFSAALVPKANT